MAEPPAKRAKTALKLEGQKVRDPRREHAASLAASRTYYTSHGVTPNAVRLDTPENRNLLKRLQTP